METRNHLHKGILLYKLGQFQEASEEFTSMYRLAPEDRLSRIYLKRCRRFLENPPPADWEGSMKLSRKG